MNIIGTILIFLWILFAIVWIVFAMSAKKSVRNGAWSQGAAFRILSVLVIFVIFQMQWFQTIASRYETMPHLAAGIAGILLCALGIGFAIWARVYLGKNWGMPMTLREHPELVTSGPYKFVRHPIYSGVLLALIGSALVGGLLWLIFFLLFGAYFIYSAKKEETNMTKLFPNEYPNYLKRTKMLVPFIF